jgi:large repetitive protein
MYSKSIALDLKESSKSKIAWVAIVALVLTMLASFNPTDRAFASGSAGITSLNPAAGPAGTSVTIAGSGFAGSYTNPPVSGNTLKVSFRSAPATVTAMTSSSITVTVPTGASGLADLTIETPTGIVTLEDAFLYRGTLTRPVVSFVTPGVSTLSANQEVLITGSGFVDVTAVLFGTVSAVSYRVESSSRIIATVPASTVPGNAQVKVTNSAGTSTSQLNLNYAEPCEIGTFANVRFGYRSSKLTKASKTLIRTTVRDMVRAECGSVTLVRYNLKIKPSTSASHRAYIKLQRARAKAVAERVETRLEILGSTAKVNFTKFSGQKSQAAVFNWDSRKSYQRVAIASRASSVPAITVTYPAAGSTAGGTSVTIRGVNFSDATAVRFGNTAATSFTIVNDNQINAVSPAGTAGTAAISVTAPTGSVSKSSAFRYTAAATITSLSTSTSSVAGSSTVTITGTNFYGVNNANSVRFGSVNASSFTVTSPTRIVATIPANAVGSQNLTVTAAGGSDSENFTYRAAPTVASISPTSGPAGGTTSVTITGSGFSGISSSSAVKFGNNNASSYTVGSSTSITAVAPAGTSGTTVTVRVANSGGSAVLKAAYTYGGVITPATQTVQGVSGTAVTTATYVANSAITTPIVYNLSPSGSLPAGLTFSTSTGVISGTPTVGLNSTTFTVSATGANGVVGSATITIAIASISPASQTLVGEVGTALNSSEAFTKLGFPGTVTFSSSELPGGLTINSSTGVISGTPTVEATETTVTVTGTSGSVTATATVSITIAGSGG